MALCFYVLGAFLPSIPGWCRHADPGIKTEPGWALRATAYLLYLSLFTGCIGIRVPVCGIPFTITKYLTTILFIHCSTWYSSQLSYIVNISSKMIFCQKFK